MVRPEADEHEKQMIVVMTTVSDTAEADRLADGLVGGGHAACVQILPPMRSVYVWKGEIERETEQLLMIKTVAERFDDVERFIRDNHSYETPEIIAVAAEKISVGYMSWLTSLLTEGKPRKS